MEGEQEGRGKVEEERRGKTGTETSPATTIGMAEEATIASAGDTGACSDGGGRKDECGSREGTGGRGSSKTGPLAMDIDRGRNCFACGGFGHMARHCRNRGMRGRGVAENRRVEYGGGRIEEISSLSDNLKEGENLKLLN